MSILTVPPSDAITRNRRPHVTAPEPASDGASVPTALTPTELRTRAFERLSDLDFSADEVAAVVATLDRLREKIESGAGRNPDGTVTVEMDMAGHDLMHGVAPGHQHSVPGTLHDVTEQAYLPEGWRFVHDQRDGCTITAYPPQ